MRKDRYNKKLKKYYVVYEEGDEELSEDEERQEKVDQDAPSPNFKKIRLQAIGCSQ